MRDLTNKHLQRFPLDAIIEHYKSTRKSITFSEDEIENLLELQYAGAKTYCVLTLLYPGLNFNFKYHQDHIHPKSFFSKRHLKTMGLADEEIEAYLAEFNCLSNLQLLQATTNIQKSNKSFHEWMSVNFAGGAERESFLMQNHIGPSDSLQFDDFLTFIQNRKQKLKHLLQRLLVSSSEIPVLVESIN